LCSGFKRHLTVALVAGCSVAVAADFADATDDPLDEVLVIATSPLPGATIDADKVPSNVETLRAADLGRGVQGLTGALNGQLGSINLNDTLADPFQPDVLYRGFEASPVLGTSQGLAVYQNGVRVNEAFGDAVNWDLIPDFAINRIDIVSANPVYGLNALGGAASLTMKDGFTHSGVDAELSGGSFGQRAGTVEFGANREQLGLYVGGRILNEDGWRLFARDRLRQLYGVLSRHADATVLDLSVTHADNQLFGQGAAPVQSLALDSRNVFTGPQDNLNRLDHVALNGSFALATGLSAQAVIYYRDFRQRVANGNTTDYTPCETAAAAGLLCQPDGATPLSNAAGQPLPDISQGGTVPIGENDFERIHSRGFGASWQLHGLRSLRTLGNQFTAGATLDSAHVEFASGAQIGVIDPALMVLPSTLFVDTPEGTGFSATPVSLRAVNRYYGFFATDTLDLTSALAVTASARFNIAQVALYDRRGTNLDGLNRYAHLNPALGATYRFSPLVTAYGGYSTTNRAPTASEIECSDPLLPCLLPASLAGDPPTLKQVIAHTYEAGLRGRIGLPGQVPEGATARSLSWSAGVFRTDLSDDIYAIANSLSTGFFQNIGATRRQGGQLALTFTTRRARLHLSYSYVAATFGSAFVMSSPANPGHDEHGNIHIDPGADLPGIPRHRIKAGADFTPTPRWSVGAALLYASSQYFKGDEANLDPPLPGYAVLEMRAAWRPRGDTELFLNVQNVTDRKYATFGIYADPTGIGAPGIPSDAESNDPRVDNRFESPAAPRAVFGGVRVRL
jgi:iron complex outermembrane receptor protein